MRVNIGFPVVQMDGRAYGHVITKLSRMGRLPHFLSYGAPSTCALRAGGALLLPHAHHAHVLLFSPYTVLSQSVLLGLRFIHNSVFSIPPTLCSDWNLCLAFSIINYVHYIFSTTRTYFKQIIILFLYIYVYLKD